MGGIIHIKGSSINYFLSKMRLLNLRCKFYNALIIKCQVRSSEFEQHVG